MLVGGTLTAVDVSGLSWFPCCCWWLISLESPGWAAPGPLRVLLLPAAAAALLLLLLLLLLLFTAAAQASADADHTIRMSV